MSHVSEVPRVFPEPPFTPELIAMFHAGALADDEAAHVRARLSDDPDARDTLASLDATVDALAGTPPAPVAIPASLRAASEATLQRLEQGAAAGEDWADRHRRRHGGLLMAAAAVLAVIGGGILTAVLLNPQRSVAPASVRQVDAADTAALLAAAHAPQLEELDANRLARCLRANRMAGASVVGAGYLVYDGRPAQVILTPTGHPGRFNALITNRNCDAGRPGTIARAVIGD